MKRLLISVGEASGDRLAAELVDALRACGCEPELVGLGGPALVARGIELVEPMERVAVMGVVEVLARLPAILAVRRRMVEALTGVDLLLCVDLPDFNLPLARAARRRGIPVVFYGSPQLWAWRPGRASTYAELGEVLCLLPFEPAHFHEVGGRATFVGHPAVDRVAWQDAPGLDWALVPGSRLAEWRQMLATFAQTVALLRERVPGAVIRVPLAPGRSVEEMKRFAGTAFVDSVEITQSLEAAVAPAGGVLAVSGTATLEIACLGRPMAVCYRVHPVTFEVGMVLVKGVDHMALPNLVAGRTIVPELVQRFDAETLCDEWQGVWGDAVQADALAGVREALGGRGAAARAAEVVAQYL